MRSGFSLGPRDDSRAFFSSRGPSWASLSGGSPQSSTARQLREVLESQSSETQASIEEATRKIVSGASKEETVQLNNNEAICIIRRGGKIQVMYLTGGNVPRQTSLYWPASMITGVATAALVFAAIMGWAPWSVVVFVFGAGALVTGTVGLMEKNPRRPGPAQPASNDLSGLS